MACHAADNLLTFAGTLDGSSSALGSVEPGSSSPLRGHVGCATDVSQRCEQGLTVADREAVLSAVWTWLLERLAGSLTGEDDPDSLSDT